MRIAPIVTAKINDELYIYVGMEDDEEKLIHVFKVLPNGRWFQLYTDSDDLEYSGTLEGFLEETVSHNLTAAQETGHKVERFE